MDIGGGEAKRTGAGDDQDRDRRHQGVGHGRRRTPDRPGDKRRHRHKDDSRHEIGGHLVGQFLNRRTAPLRFGDHLDDLRQHGVGADAPGLDDQRAPAVDRRTGHRVAKRLFDRHRFAGQHGLVNRRVAFGNHPIHRHFVSRAYPQSIADLNVFERDFLFAAIGADDPRRRRSQVQ